MLSKELKRFKAEKKVNRNVKVAVDIRRKREKIEYGQRQAEL